MKTNLFKRKTSKFVKSTIILIIGGFFTKLLSTLIRVVITRLLGPVGLGLYMMIMPTFSLLIGISLFGLPIAISKLVSEDTKNNKNLVFGIIPISLFINCLIIIFLLIFSKYISFNLLKDSRTYYGLIAIGLVLPFINISSILRSYFFGKERMIPHVVSNIAEDFIRLIIIIIGLPFFLTKGIEYAVCFLILTNIFSELSSIIILFLYGPKNFSIKKEDFIPNINYTKEILNISLPTTTSRLIGSIGHFLEPIIITFVLLKIGYSNNFILTEYGIITGYIMPILLLPSFFTGAISHALIPTISYSYVRNKLNLTKTKIKQGLYFSLLIGIPITILFLIFPRFLLKIIYNQVLGINYLKTLAPFFLLFYLQTPLRSCLQAMNKSKIALMGTLKGIIIKISILFVFSFFNIGLWGYIIAICVNITYVTIHHMFNVFKILK